MIETKSGCLVKTPGKFSTYVMGKRKNNKGKKDPWAGISIPSQHTVTATEQDITSASLVVNTLLLTNSMADGDTTLETMNEENSIPDTDLAAFEPIKENYDE